MNQEFVEIGSAVLTIFLLIINLKAAVSSEKTRAELAEWKADAYRHRDVDKEELKKWINGSFMRANEVKAYFDTHRERVTGIDLRLTAVEHTVRSHHPKA